MIKRITILIAFIAIFSSSLFAQNQFRANLQTVNYTQPFHVCKEEPVSLEAFPKADSLAYDWYRNGQLLFSSKSNKLTLNEGGFYKVTVRANNFQSESEEMQIEQCTPVTPTIVKNDGSKGTLAVFPTITSANPVICGSNTSAVLQASPANAAYTYQWYFSTSEYSGFLAIAGATSSSHTTTTLGYYQVGVSDGSPPNNSQSIRVTNTPQAILSDINGNRYYDVITSGGTAQLKVTLYGGAPYTFNYYDGSTLRTINTSTNPYTLNLTLNQNRNYYLNSVSNSCGSGNGNGSNRVIVDASTSATLTNPTSLDVCAGSTISLPYTTIGTWQTERRLNIYLINSSTGNSINNSYQTSFSQNSIEYTLPAALPIGTYKVVLGGSLPYFNSVTSSYTLNVNATGCLPTATFTGSNVACGLSYIYANQSSSSNTYQWYKDGVLISSTNSYGYIVTQTGNYKVNISNASTGYNSTSSESLITINGVIPVITSPNSVLCGSNTSATLNSSITTGTFQWYKLNPSNGNQIAIMGATNASYNANSTGEYLVSVSDGTCDIKSNYFSVTSTPSATLTNTSDNFNPIDINAGGTATLKVNLTGTAPWSFSLYDGLSNKYYTATSSPFTVDINPTQSRRYYIDGLNNSCGYGNYLSNSMIINVLPTPTFTLNTPTITTVCQGSSINIPYTISGTWGTERDLEISLVDNTTGNINYSSTQFYNSSNPIVYHIPTSIPVGTYKVNVRSILPYINQSVAGTYTISITASGAATCTAPVASINGNLNSCSETNIKAYPRGTGYTYQWYKDGVIFNNGYTGNYNYVSSSGTYSVVVSNSSTGYSSTSAGVVITTSGISQQISNQNGTILCSTGSSVVLESNNSNAVFTYQWYYSSDGNLFTPVSGATAKTHTATLPGIYYVIIKNGTCEIRSYSIQTCPLILTNKPQTACVNSAVNVPFNRNDLSSGSLLTLQLLDATTGAVVNANLSSFVFDYSTNSFNFNLPNTVTAGTYKFRVTSSSPAITSPISEGTLTVLSSSAGTGPVLTASPTSFSSLGTNVSFSATGCPGSIEWYENGYLFTTNNTFSNSLNYSTLIKAFCVGTAGGCTSMPSQITVNYNCTDALEPNNTAPTATPITVNSYTSPTICLDGFINDDWFSWNYNGKIYYIKASLSYYYSTAGQYQFKLTQTGSSLVVETLPISSGQYLNTVLRLFDSDGTTILASNSGSNGNGFSKITYTLPNPCPAVQNLVSPANDIATGQTSTIKGSAITATNKINNTATVDYRGQNTITLNPGFETKMTTGGSFKAQIKGCADSSN